MQSQVGPVEAEVLTLIAIVGHDAQTAMHGDQELLAAQVRVFATHLGIGHRVDEEAAARGKGQFAAEFGRAQKTAHVLNLAHFVQAHALDAAGHGAGAAKRCRSGGELGRIDVTDDDSRMALHHGVGRHITSHHGAGFDARVGADSNARRQHRRLAHARSVADQGARADAGARQHARAFSDTSAGAHKDLLANDAGFGEHGARHHAALRAKPDAVASGAGRRHRGGMNKRLWQ